MKNIEIERKFLVTPNFLQYVNPIKVVDIKQWYFLNTPKQSIRLRQYGGNEMFITWKSNINNQSISRTEHEYKIPFLNGMEIIERFDNDGIIKKRYIVLDNNKTWEIDVFEGDNEGLIIAEIELKSEEEIFIQPHWILQEVTNDPKYLNCNLVSNPYKNWK